MSAVSGKTVRGSSATGANASAAEYNADTPVRPLRARISALNNTVKEGEMPTVVAVAGFSPAGEPKTVEGDEADLVTEDGAVRGRGKWGVKGGYHLRWDFETMNIDLGGDRILKAHGEEEGAGGGGRDLYEFFLDQNMLIVAWKDSPKKEDAVVFVRDEVRR